MFKVQESFRVRLRLGRCGSVCATSVKITDYGLSTNMYNRSHVTIQQGEGPYSYLSEEALLKGRFGEPSDVWAFGVLAWELLTLGYTCTFSATQRKKKGGMIGKISRQNQ